jgi:diacylglycerol kinase family enzyme
VLPLGTLNHFARDLAIPVDLSESVRVLRDGCPRAVDVGSVNDRIFLNNSGLGLYPEIVRQRERRQRAGAAKWPAAVVAAARVLQRYRLLTLRLSIAEKVVQRRVPAILIGNNEYSTEGALGPYRTALDAGTLSIYLPRSRGRARLLWNSLRALIGSVTDGDWFEVILTDRMSVASHHPALHVSLDGEVAVLATPLEYAVRPRALMVMAPEPESFAHISARG